MKVTDEMINAFAAADFSGLGNADWEDSHIRVGLQAVLKDVPDVEPFTFAGYEAHEVYLHPCGTVVDVLPGPNDTRACVEAGECDCETPGPWRRIYVEKQA